MRAFCIIFLLCVCAQAATDSFLEAEVQRLERQSLDDFLTAEGRQRRQAEIMEMFGLLPARERGDLKPTITGRLEREEFVVEKLHFQSSPGLYVTANFYLPRRIEAPLPAVLYVCGHTFMRTNGVSFGNKAGYQHHGVWFARNGYACLVIDTVQLGEIAGIHHGTYREKMWWWNSRGYSSGAVEAWNSIRALDYLETRPEVDKARGFGVTGRSGGGAYSWSAIACDPRVKVAAPVAGITDLRGHVLDGVVEGHCDCMYFVNTLGWDYHMLAACAAPRPLLIVNTDKDSIFPLDGVVRLHSRVADLYQKFGATNELGLVIGPGPHKDTQDLQIPVFRWFNKHLRGKETIVDTPATNFFTPQELRVFDTLPADERVSTVHEWFIPKAAPGPKIANAEEWAKQRAAWMQGLKEKVFRNWPKAEVSGGGAFLKDSGGGTWTVTDPRPIGHLSEREQTHYRRRYMLVGHTLDSMRVFDIVQAVKGKGPVTLAAEGDMAANALMASLFLDNVKSLRLSNLPASFEKGPDYLNVLRALDIREALALASERCQLEVTGSSAGLDYARSIAKTLGWK